METEERAVIFLKTRREPSVAQVVLKKAGRGRPRPGSGLLVTATVDDVASAVTHRPSAFRGFDLCDNK